MNDLVILESEFYSKMHVLCNYNKLKRYLYSIVKNRVYTELCETKQMKDNSQDKQKEGHTKEKS